MKMTLRSAGWAAMLAGLMIVGTGCASVASVAGDAIGDYEPGGPYPIPRVYSGVAYDWSGLRQGGEDCGICFVDLPLSFAADTLALPYTIPRQRKYGDLYDGSAAP